MSVTNVCFCWFEDQFGLVRDVRPEDVTRRDRRDRVSLGDASRLGPLAGARRAHDQKPQRKNPS